MIVLFDVVRRESTSVRREIFLTAAVSGLANAAILSSINVASQHATGEFDTRQAVNFIVAMMVYVTGLRSSLAAMAQISLEVIHGIRVRLAEKIQRAELETLERIGKGPILNALTHDTTTLGEAGEVITAALQAAVLICFATLYIAFLSWPAFLAVLLFASAGAFALLRHRALAASLFRRTTEAEVGLLEHIGHVVDGFREAKLDARVRDGLFADLATRSTSVTALKIRTRNLLQNDTVTARALIYLLIGSVVFLLPTRIVAGASVASEVTTAILFIAGPLTLLATLAPQLARCNAAARSILRVEDELDREMERGSSAAAFESGGLAAALQMAPESIALENVEFRHRGAAGEPFVLGPLSLELHRGELLFIVGGNGSGKSTLLKVLTGLYPAEAGTIRVDGTAVTDLPAYRELFSTVFTDFHLFERLYGLLDEKEERVGELLALMRLTDKTAFAGGRFTNRRLSTGQKKRLAMIVAMLERRPVLVFDEPAADQDPPFRRFLYEELFPRLRDEGRFVIVVSHDDRYFHLANRVVRVEDGRIAAAA